MIHGIPSNRPKCYPVKSYCRILRLSVYLELINQCFGFFFRKDSQQERETLKVILLVRYG